MTPIQRERYLNELNPWTAEVHAHLLKTGGWMTALEMTTMFGRPDGVTPVGQRLHIAVKQNLFAAEKVGQLNRYKALDKFKAPIPEVSRDGIRALPSVWAYASAIGGNQT